MSIILDALRKSEHQRQRNASPDLAGHRVKQKSTGRTPWLAIILVLLVLNAVLVATLWLRPAEQPKTTATATQTRPAPYREARRPVEQPSPSAAVIPPSTVAQATPPAPATTAAAPPPSADKSLPSLETLQLEGVISLPPMRMDLHVYDPAPAERFVFINMKKHTEGSTLQEGPVVEEITPEGVILTANGRRFIMSKN